MFICIFFLISSTSLSYRFKLSNNREIISLRTSNDFNQIGRLLSDTFDDLNNSFVDKIIQCISSYQYKQQYKNLSSKLSSQQYELLIMKENDNCIGFCELGILNKNEPTLAVLAISPVYQNKRYGTEMLQACEDIVYDHWKLKELYVACESKSLQFFRKQEFIEEEIVVNITVRNGLTEEIRPHQLMKKILTGSNEEENEKSLSYESKLYTR